MSGHDDSTEHGISGGIRCYASDAADGHRFCRPGARLHLGHLGVTRYVQGLAERAGRFVRRGLEHAARQHCTYGAGFLSAVRTLGGYRIGSGASPVFITGGYPVTSERKS